MVSTLFPFTDPSRGLKSRLGPILPPGPLAERPDVLALNLAAGCDLGCAFCPAGRGPDRAEQEMALYADTAVRLHAELSETLARPQAVIVCPATDPFPRHREVQRETARVVEVLAEHGVEAWLMTRGFV